VNHFSDVPRYEIISSENEAFVEFILSEDAVSIDDPSLAGQVLHNLFIII
jgi:hypothetical protein